MIIEAYAPRIKDHAGQIANMIDMKVCEKDGFQAGEIETGRNECGG